jgi:hypothetical protein
LTFLDHEHHEHLPGVDPDDLPLLRCRGRETRVAERTLLFDDAHGRLDEANRDPGRCGAGRVMVSFYGHERIFQAQVDQPEGTWHCCLEQFEVSTSCNNL